MQNNKQKVVKRTIKDSVFSALFNEPKYLRQLCKVLKPDADEAELDTISNVTIKNILVNGLYNDLALSMGLTAIFLFFCEAQSIWSENICYRHLEYFVEWTHKYIVDNKYNIYSRKAVPLPVPQFYVVYTGKDEQPEEYITLRDTNFGGVCGGVEVKVKVLHMSDENNILDQYIKFARISDEQVKEKGRTKEAIESIIKICIENDILKEFLESKRSEVTDMLDILFDQEYVTEAYGHELLEEGRKEGLKEGRKEGREEGILTMVKNLMQSLSITAEKALEMLRIPKGEWNEYLPKLS